MVLEKNGIPVLPIYADIVDAREWNDEEIQAQVSRFIEERCMSR